jgi:hypothetical protein
VLAFDCPITDFALAANAQSVFQSVMGLTLVETDLGTALHVGMMPAAIVATARRISGQFWTMRPSLILPPIRLRNSLGAAAGSNR